ncbi:hypothetical protein ACVW0V_000716 [Bradyrhizobium elkanii]
MHRDCTGREHQDRNRDAEQPSGAEIHQARRILRHIDHPGRRDPEGEAIDHEAGSQRHEQRRRLDESDHHAVDDADQHRDRQRQQHCRKNGHAVLHVDQRDRPGTRHDRDLGEVDAAADHDQPHAEAEHAEDGNTPQQIQEIGDGGKAVQRQAEHDQERDGDQEHDLLLARLCKHCAQAR